MGQMTVEQWYGTIKTGLTKKLTENKEALPAGFNQQRFILNCITVIQDMMKDNKKKKDRMDNQERSTSDQGWQIHP